MSKRRSIDVKNFKHSNPTPAASRVGNIFVSGGIGGLDPQTGKVPEDGELQVVLAYGNMVRILEAAGATTDDVVNVQVLVSDLGLLDIVNREWLKMFPDEQSRPARHFLRYDYFGTQKIHLVVTAVIDR